MTKYDFCDAGYCAERIGDLERAIRNYEKFAFSVYSAETTEIKRTSPTRTAKVQITFNEPKDYQTAVLLEKQGDDVQAKGHLKQAQTLYSQACYR